MSMKARTRGHLKSAWTPMSDGATNNKLYEERSGLVNKWGMWKKNYVEHIKSLQVLRPMTPGMRHKLNMSPKSMRKGGKDYELDKHKIKVPWKGSDPVPQDTWRYNVLDNNDVVEEVNKQRQKKVCGDEALRVAQTAKSKVNTGNILRSSSMTRMNTIGPNSRKVWAELKKKNKTVCIDVPRPGPVSPPPKTHRSTRKSPTRSARDPPSSNLFSKKPWNVPDYDSDN
ncbi:hypothetical protein LOTGIDRAFT_235809 [Lottia gigantea]|uniref:Uncharacterized protein n=1 Tax=Lottia gigantea TaxID=225164 RepID=V3Z3S4_LOTGI|nr:hypothetical protein LOTGIDRAFT_235809 [Lottia gigantea]ESO85303.1 hypothetical protein LOTGIDRAFT_235809 [Lottia gigantea]